MYLLQTIVLYLPILALAGVMDGNSTAIANEDDYGPQYEPLSHFLSKPEIELETESESAAETGLEPELVEDPQAFTTEMHEIKKKFASAVEIAKELKRTGQEQPYKEFIVDMKMLLAEHNSVLPTLREGHARDLLILKIGKNQDMLRQLHSYSALQDELSQKLRAGKNLKSQYDQAAYNKFIMTHKNRLNEYSSLWWKSEDEHEKDVLRLQVDCISTLLEQLDAFDPKSRHNEAN